MNKIGKITTTIILLVVVLMIVVLSNLDRGIKTVVETIGPELTGSEVTLSSVDLSLTDAKGSFSGLRVGNPQGFAAADAFKLGLISFAMDAEHLADNTIVIDSLRIVAPEITMGLGSVLWFRRWMMTSARSWALTLKSAVPSSKSTRTGVNPRAIRESKSTGIHAIIG